jgi:hypothetical protein
VQVDLVGAVLARLDYQPLQQAALGKQRELKIDRAVVKITESFCNQWFDRKLSSGLNYRGTINRWFLVESSAGMTEQWEFVDLL